MLVSFPVLVPPDWAMVTVFTVPLPDPSSNASENLPNGESSCAAVGQIRKSSSGGGISTAAGRLAVWFQDAQSSIWMAELH